MRFAAIIITVICCILMFRVKRQTKAAIFIMGAMTLTQVSVPFLPLQKANHLFLAVFLLSEWNYLKQHLREFWHTPFLRYPILVVTFSTIICVWTSSYLNESFSQGFVYLRTELLLKYFAICYAFWAYSSETSIKQTLRLSLYCLIVLTFFGVLNYITKSAVFVNAVTVGKTSEIASHAGEAYGDVFVDSDRFRVISMFKFPFDYGYICSAIFLLHLHCFIQKIEKKKTFIVAALCCLFGIYLCGCRTVLGAFAVSLSFYFFWSFKLRKTSLWFLIAVVVLVFSYGVVPFIEEKVDQISDIFSDNPQTAGSSLKLRLIQFDATLDNLDEEDEFTGQGHGYYRNDLFNNKKADKNLFGIESVIFIYILERGFLGLALWALFYVLIFIYFIKHRRKYKRLTGLGVSFLMLYLFFSIGTGELGSVYPTMLLFGFVFKAIEYDKRRKIIYSLQN